MHFASKDCRLNIRLQILNKVKVFIDKSFRVLVAFLQMNNQE